MTYIIVSQNSYTLSLLRDYFFVFVLCTTTLWLLKSVIFSEKIKAFHWLNHKDEDRTSLHHPPFLTFYNPTDHIFSFYFSSSLPFSFPVQQIKRSSFFTVTLDLGEYSSQHKNIIFLLLLFSSTYLTTSSFMTSELLGLVLLPMDEMRFLGSVVLLFGMAIPMVASLRLGDFLRRRKCGRYIVFRT